jgi:large repetitive protein
MNSISKGALRSQRFKTLLCFFFIYQLLQTSQVKASSWVLSKKGKLDFTLPKRESTEGTGTINGLAWQDNNQNGQQDTNELPITGMKINLWLFDAVGTSLTFQDAATTNTLGQYQFKNLKEGNYLIEFSFDEILQANFIKFTDVNVGTDETDSDVSSTGFSKSLTVSGSVQKVDAGLIPKPFSQGSIGDFVWLDSNKNGQQDANEEAVTDVQVALWLFDPAGTSLSKIDSVKTNETGFYSFNNLNKANYVVEFILPENAQGFTEAKVGSNISDSDVGTRGFTHPIAIDPLDATKRHIKFIDAGLLPKPNLEGSIGDFVWLDSNKNGVQDTDEHPVEGISITLWAFDVAGTSLTKKDTTVSDASGKYQFSRLQTGKYVVEFMLNEKQKAIYEGFTTANIGAEETDSDVGTRGFTTIISIETATENQRNINHIDAGLIPKVMGSISDVVWQDNNKDGHHDATEPPVAGINVKLWVFDAMGTSLTEIDSTVTTSTGEYHFYNLPKGEYIVQFTLNELQQTRYETVSTTTARSANRANPNAGIINYPVSIDPTDPAMRDINVVSSGLIPKSGCIDVCLPVTIRR